MTFSEQLKYLRKQKGLSQVQLAHALSITQPAVANYESGARMPSIKLLQKMALIFDIAMHELVTEDEIAADMQMLHREQSKILKTNPDVFYSVQVEKLMIYLLNGHLADIVHFIAMLHYYEITTAMICERILKVVLYRIGGLWANGEIDVFQEHFMTEAIHLGMQQLYAKRHPFKKAGFTTFIGVTAPQEMHDMGLRMMHHELMQAGWTTYYLGSQTAIAEVVAAVTKWEPHVLGISCTMPQHLNGVHELINAIRLMPNGLQPLILVSGQALESLMADTVKKEADLYAESMEEAIYKLSTLKRGIYA
ncbi:cobalamin-dependent protein [Fusibacter paucivorans]|uniref:Cobalamin-dependent protein n=1 Tax=Fusibacter paucivorans TaxID=76009 RepID=A0ABS5PN33_9FIRM|nr:cobalamin-dependent protein [Fusibacter paucivorans]MBS7526282.1 cobalamin-dependent protein [Fusibacter paucivorans]